MLEGIKRTIEIKLSLESIAKELAHSEDLVAIYQFIKVFGEELEGVQAITPISTNHRVLGLFSTGLLELAKQARESVTAEVLRT